jgi:hypothetical protein
MADVFLFDRTVFESADCGLRDFEAGDARLVCGRLSKGMDCFHGERKDLWTMEEGDERGGLPDLLG